MLLSLFLLCASSGRARFRREGGGIMLEAPLSSKGSIPGRI